MASVRGRGHTTTAILGDGDERERVFLLLTAALRAPGSGGCWGSDVNTHHSPVRPGETATSRSVSTYADVDDARFIVSHGIYCITWLMTSISNMLFSFAFALYFLALYVYGIKFSKKKKKNGAMIVSAAIPFPYLQCTMVRAQLPGQNTADLSMPSVPS